MSMNQIFACHDCKVVYELGKFTWETTEQSLDKLLAEHEGHDVIKTLETDYLYDSPDYKIFREHQQ